MLIDLSTSFIRGAQIIGATFQRCETNFSVVLLCQPMSLIPLAGSNVVVFLFNKKKKIIVTDTEVLKEDWWL